MNLSALVSRAVQPLPQNTALTELFEETRSSVPGLTSMLKDEPDQYRPVFADVFEQTVTGEQQALQQLPSQLDLPSATLEFIEGGLVAGSFGGMLQWTRGEDVDGILADARQLVATGQAREALAQHQAQAEAVLAAPGRERLHEGFLEGVWVGALEAALHVGA